MDNERRRFFRIDDRVLARCREIPAAALIDAKRAIHRGIADTSDLENELGAIGRRLTQRIEDVRTGLPEVAAVLDDLNRKVGLLQELVLTHHPETVAAQDDLRVVEANLSGGGMAFTDPAPRAPGAFIEIELVLLPHDDHMRVVGTVVDCRAADNGAYELSVEFDEIRDADRERLIQHIVRKQSERLRAERAARGSIAA